MGYDVERFVSKVHDELLCEICLGVLEKPRESPCEHLFCLECISKWLLIHNTCPVDRKSLMEDDLKEPCRIIRNLLNKMQVKCDAEEGGCTTIVKLGNLAEHLTTCTKNLDAEIKCNQGCNLKIKRRDQARNCFEHFQDEIRSQRMEVSRLLDALEEEQEDNEDLRDDVTSLQREIEELVVASIGKVRFLFCNDAFIVWHIFENMEDHQCPSIIEAADGRRVATAQLAERLEPYHPTFSLCVIRNEINIGMGLAGRTREGAVNLSQGYRYMNYGTIMMNGKALVTVEEWNEGDMISCNVEFQPVYNSVNTSMSGIVSFYKNSKLISAICSPQLAELFPTVCMGEPILTDE